MTKPVPVVDLFAGAGGLSEGFAACRQPDGSPRYRIQLSIEKDPTVYSTLLLRSFLRQFNRNFPSEYYDFLNNSDPEPDWKNSFPLQWQAAKKEAYQMELGTAKADKFLRKELRRIHAVHQGRTVLIGGPPCQAYSLIGRARLARINPVARQNDRRIYFYREYINALQWLRPQVALFENVKGILSSNGIQGSVFDNLRHGLRHAFDQDCYKLYSLSSNPSQSSNEATGPSPRDFIVRSEEYGIPQSRHRVFIVCVRRDVYRALSPEPLLTLKKKRHVTISEVIGTMPPLRSGLSSSDSLTTWQDTIHNARIKIKKAKLRLSNSQKQQLMNCLDKAIPLNSDSLTLTRKSRQGADTLDSCPDTLREWILDSELNALLDHETRAHMEADLARYLFAACFSGALGCSPMSQDFPQTLIPRHSNWSSGKFSDRFRVQLPNKPASTVTSHISKDGHYYIHYDPSH